MSDINIQMKYHDNSNWNNLFPKTLASITLMGDGRTVQKAIEETNDLLENKVNKVDGKTLTTNDFTTSFRTKLENLKDHSNDINNLQTNKADKSTTYSKAEVDNLVAGSASGIPVQSDEPEGVNLWFEEIGG